MIRKVTQNCIDLIKHYEGFRETAYICPAGYKTIGYGHLVPNGENIQTIGIQQAEIYLYTDLINSEKSVLRLIRVPLEDYQFDALVSFVFNLGGGALQRSILRQKVNREEHDLVPQEFIKWVYASGRKLSGLIKRRNTEALLYAIAELYFNGAYNI